MDPILGTIIWFSGNYAPLGFMYCNGAELPIQNNTALFSIFRNDYGGDGQRTFKLPDLRPDITEYKIEKDENGNDKVVAVVRGKRDWRSDEPKCLIVTIGSYPMRQ